ncbi:MAG TPA: ABC transporter permease subunit [Candidatus Binatus sp.]|nr:ABC transporter permease subunit [Candidatus Binatus sp.]
MTGYAELVAKELRESWRTFRLPVMGLLFLALGISSPVILKVLPDVVRMFAPPGFQITLPDAGLPAVIDQFLKNTIQFGALAAILLTMGSVATEKERGTAAFVLAKPVTRVAFLAAKLTSLGIVFAVAFGLASIGGFVYTGLLFGWPDALPWLAMTTLVWLSTMVYVGITFLGSVAMRSALGASGIGFGGLIVLSIASIVPTLSTWLPAGLWPVARAIALGQSSPDLDPLRTIAMSLAIVAITIALAMARFRRLEL